MRVIWPTNFNDALTTFDMRLHFSDDNCDVGCSRSLIKMKCLLERF